MKNDDTCVLYKGLKYRWSCKHIEKDLITDIAHTHNISYPIAHVLASRGFSTPENIRAFLFTSYQEELFQPHLMKGIVLAAARIAKAIKNKEKILIFGDYDVDGITSSSLLLAALIPLGANVNFYLPNRYTDGYGLSEKAVKQAHTNGYSLIITVDNGITAFQAAEKARECGIDLIITDHHKPLEKIPYALAIIDPQQEDCMYPFKHLAGVGVAFKLASMIYLECGIPTLPEKMYELLLLGTIADVAPLIDENRYWVRYGLRQINKSKSLALQTLIANSTLGEKRLTSLDVGFMLTPQINALGRISNPRDAVKFIIGNDQAIISSVGTTLKTLNEERKLLEANIYQQVDQQIQNKSIDVSQEYALVVAHDKWPSGIIGLVAGKLAHNYGRPTILFHITSDGLAKGSCRSVPAINIFDCLKACSSHLVSYGGHSHAAGLTLRIENLPAFKEQLSQHLASQITLDQLVPRLDIDATLTLGDLDHKCVTDHALLEPFGNSNPQPTFCISGVTLVKPPTLLKEKHTKCMVFSQGVIKPVIFFNRPDVYTFLQNREQEPFHLAASIVENEWQGAVRIELQGLDVAP